MAASWNKRKQRIRKELFNKDPKCFWCRRMTVLDNFNKPDCATIDHIIPKSMIKQNKHRKDNLVLSCDECNQKKGNKIITPEEYKKQRLKVEIKIWSSCDGFIENCHKNEIVNSCY